MIFDAVRSAESRARCDSITFLRVQVCFYVNVYGLESLFLHHQNLRAAAPVDGIIYPIAEHQLLIRALDLDLSCNCLFSKKHQRQVCFRDAKDFTRLCSPDIARGSDARGRGRGRFRGCGGGVEVIGSTLINAARQTELTRYDC